MGKLHVQSGAHGYGDLAGDQRALDKKTNETYMFMSHVLYEIHAQPHAKAHLQRTAAVPAEFRSVAQAAPSESLSLTTGSHVGKPFL